jgi:hypothetical protein
LSRRCKFATACDGVTFVVGEPVRVAVPLVTVPERVAVAADDVAARVAVLATGVEAAVAARVAVEGTPVVALAAGAVLGRAVATEVAAVDGAGAVFVTVVVPPHAARTVNPTPRLLVARNR